MNVVLAIGVPLVYLAIGAVGAGLVNGSDDADGTIAALTFVAWPVALIVWAFGVLLTPAMRFGERLARRSRPDQSRESSD